MRRFDMEQWGGKEVARLLALVETERRYYQKIVAGVPIGRLVGWPRLRNLASHRTFRDKFLPSENLKDIFGRTLDFVLPAAEVREAALEVIRTRKPVRHRYAELHTLTERRRLRISVSYLRNTEEEEPGAEEELLVLLEDAVPAELQIDSSSEPRRLTGDTTAGEAHQRSLELRRLEREMERRLRSAELEKEQLRANWKERERVLLSAQQDLELPNSKSGRPSWRMQGRPPAANSPPAKLRCPR